MSDVNLGSIRAKVIFDTSDVKKGSDRARDELGRFTADTKRKLDRMSADSKAALRDLGRTLATSVSAPLFALGFQAVKVARDMDSLKRGLTAVAGSSEEAEKQLVRLKEVAKLPGLGFQEAIEGSVRLQAAGINARLAERSLMAFGNALATVGKGKAELDGVTLALSQIQSKGKVSAEEINQIAERVPQIRKVMIQAFGTADTEILQKAKLTSQEFIETVVGALEKLPKVTSGVQNDFENFQDTINAGLNELGKAVLPPLTKAMKDLEPRIKEVTTWFRNLSPEAKDAIVKIGGAIAIAGPVVVAFGSIAGAVSNLATAFGALRIAASTALGPVGAIAAIAGTGGFLLWRELRENERINNERMNRLTTQGVNRQRQDPNFLRSQIRNLRASQQGFINSMNQQGVTIPPSVMRDFQQKKAQVDQALREAYADLAAATRPRATARTPAGPDANAIAKSIRDRIAAAQAAAGKKKGRRGPSPETLARRAAAERERVAEANREAEAELFHLTHNDAEDAWFDAHQRFAERIKSGVKRQTAYSILVQDIEKNKKEIAEKAKELNDEIRRLRIGDQFERDRFDARQEMERNLARGYPEANAGALFQERLVVIQRERAEFYKGQVAEGLKAMNDFGARFEQMFSERQERAREAVRTTFETVTKMLRDMEEARQREAEAAVQSEDRKQKFLRDANLITQQEYFQYLTERIAKEQEFTTEWYRLQDEARNILINGMKKNGKEAGQSIGDGLTGSGGYVKNAVRELATQSMYAFQASLNKGFGGTLGQILVNTLTNLLSDVFSNAIEIAFRKKKRPMDEGKGGGILGAIFGGGSILGPLGGLFGFDDPWNDARARRWGFDFGHHFTSGVADYGRQRSSRMATAGPGGGNTYINVHLNGGQVVREEADIQRIAEAVSFLADRRLPVARVASRRV